MVTTSYKEEILIPNAMANIVNPPAARICLSSPALIPRIVTLAMFRDMPKMTIILLSGENTAYCPLKSGGRKIRQKK